MVVEQWATYPTAQTSGLEKILISHGLVTVTHLSSYTDTTIANIAGNSEPVANITAPMTGICASSTDIAMLSTDIVAFER